MPNKQSDRELRRRQRGFDAIHSMRSKGHSFSRAATESHIDRRTLRKLFPSLWGLDASGRVTVKPGDNFVRHLQFLTPQGLDPGTVRGYRNAKLIAEHSAAVRYFFDSQGDTSRLKPFRGKSVLVSGKRMTFATDPQVLKRLDAAGEVSFEELYVYAG